ncbi:MAG: hypothetical protein ACXWES_07465, partial [Solirubrobacterales bacterium]
MNHVSCRAFAAAIAVAASLVAAPGSAAAVTPYQAAVHVSRAIGSRPAGSAAEARAHDYVAKQFRSAGLAVEVAGFPVPG